MKNELENLLNTLIQRGWKPFGDIDIAEFNQIENTFVAINYDNKVIGQPKIRQIASIESGLWQFVCDNRLLKGPDATDDWQKNGDYTGHYDELFYASQYQYYLIESALCDEDKLEEFLLSNIVIKDE